MKMNELASQSDSYDPKFTYISPSYPNTLTKTAGHSQRGDYYFNFGSSPAITCANTAKFTTCGECESCILMQKLSEVREWLFHFGHRSKKHFMLGLLQRIQSINLLKNVTSVLKFTATKDHTYARARINPSLDTDIENVNSGNTISADQVEKVIDSAWEWFSHANNWTKKNFMLNLLQMCESHLLCVLYRQACTHLASEIKAAESHTVMESDTTEATFKTPSELSHQSCEQMESCHSLMSRFGYGTSNLFFKEENVPILQQSKESLMPDNDDESMSIIDPMIFVMPTSAKAYVGVSQHKDFIRCLPVHLSKMILSMLDMVSLYNALCVSPNWRKLVEEVRVEISVNQQIKEEVMLMQGSSTLSANPVYANDVDVPVPEVKPGTHEIIYTSDNIIKATFKSQLNFQTVYTGVRTKKVIMEERNVYCGTYNVMVVVGNEDSHRVMHTDGSSLIAVGFKDRKVHFVECETGKEKGPVITGHAGSVKCCHLLLHTGRVLSGSYDTSIRCWSTETGKCLKILRGHQDTVNCITVVGDVVASGSMDKCVKIWNLENGKCLKTFKHRSPVLAVGLNEEICVSGCDSGKVKVWELGSGNLIKILTGHHAAVTAVKLDRWHIITGGKDGYALLWSTVGQYSRCLTAFRHQKEVLCLEFLYLRVITGSADGRIRIWNILTGQCCRIMRGNSQSDPILSIIATEDRITVNTLNSLLVMNFEKMKWDYTLQSDKVMPLISYRSYSEAPLQSQPYSYVRAQRMRKAGTSNFKSVHHNSYLAKHNTGTKNIQSTDQPPQLHYSSISLSNRNLEKAIHVQKCLKSLTDISACSSSYHEKNSKEQTITASPDILFQPESLHSQGKIKARTKSTSNQSLTVVKMANNGTDPTLTHHLSRRISWAFDKPLIPKDKIVSLSEIKAFLRSQIRMKKGNVIPPDFIYLTVSKLQKSAANSEKSFNAKLNMQDWNLDLAAVRKRPMSSPSRIDSRTKLPVEKMGLEIFADDNVLEPSDLSCAQPLKIEEQIKPQLSPNKETFTTEFVALSVNASSHSSIHPSSVKTTIPTSWTIHPVSAGLKISQQNKQIPVRNSILRSMTTFDNKCIKTIPVSNVSSYPSAEICSPRSKYNNQSSDNQQASIIPKFINVKIMDKLAKQNQLRNITSSQRESNGEPMKKVNMYKQLLREHATLKLRTCQQEEELMRQIKQSYTDVKTKENEDLEKKKREAWIALATGKAN